MMIVTDGGGCDGDTDRHGGGYDDDSDMEHGVMEQSQWYAYPRAVSLTVNSSEVFSHIDP